MAALNPYSQYQETQFKTATPGKLLLMTFDAAIQFARVAVEKMRQHKYDEQGANITRVQNILLELMASLDMDKDPRLAANLYSLYSYMFDRLTRANVQDDEAPLLETIQILTEMRATWAQAELAIRSGTTHVVAAELSGELVRQAA